MVALLVSVPAVAGAAFTSELYSPHLDVQQRMLILETLASAAQQMANPRLRLQAGRSQAGARANPLEAAAEPVGEAATWKLLARVPALCYSLLMYRVNAQSGPPSI